MSQHALMPFGTRWESGLEPLSDAPSLSQMGERSTNQVCASSAPSVIRINHYVGSFAEFLSRVDVPDGFERRFSATYPAQFDVRDLNVVRDLNALRWTCGSRQHAPTASGCEGHPPGPLVVLNEPRIEESSRGRRAPRRNIDEPKRAAPPSPLRTNIVRHQVQTCATPTGVVAVMPTTRNRPGCTRHLNCMQSFSLLLPSLASDDHPTEAHFCVLWRALEQ